MNDVTLRDYFAARVMQSLLAASASLDEDEELSFGSATVNGVGSSIEVQGEENGITFQYSWARYYADEAYVIADAMIKARELKDD